MTPLQIKMMLHYYAIAEPYGAQDPRHAESETVKEQRRILIEAGLLEPRPHTASLFGCTERGLAYVEHYSGCRCPWRGGSFRGLSCPNVDKTPTY